MQITVHNPNNLPTMDYREWIPLQGHLKDLSKENYNKLKNVLIKRGFTVPAFLWNNPEDGKYYIMDAHQRQRVLIKENATPYELPYVLIEANSMQDAKSQLLEITSQYGTITYDGLDEFIEIAELPQAEVYEAVHYDGLPLLGENTEMPEVEEDDAPEVSTEPPISKLGEVYQLGKHRVMCGDSTDIANVELLMNGAKADMVFTDPPYGMDLDTDYSKLPSTKSEGNKKYSRVIGDGQEYDPSIVLEIFDYCNEIIMFGADYYADKLPKGGSWYVWDKRVDEKFDRMIGSGFELAWSKMKHKREIARFNNTLFSGESEAKDKVHPTQKPTKMIAWFFERVKGNNVIDLFLGSGSTLIACEQTDRTCYGMELDPKYVDVIRKRYWKFVNDGNEEGWQEGTGTIQREKSEDGK